MGTLTPPVQKTTPLARWSPSPSAPTGATLVVLTLTPSCVRSTSER
jgi:hypothetical protein